MTRFGDFTVHAQVGESFYADAVVATHDTLGGPYFVKRYTRLHPDSVRDLVGRADRLVGVKSPQLLEHLGHGVVDGVAFTVAPMIEGIDLVQFIASLKERRVTLGLDVLFYIVQEMARAVMALRSLPADAAGHVMTHGDVSAPHIRLTRQGRILLTGVATPRGLVPGRPSHPVWDGAGVAAAVYDLLPLLRPGATRPPLPVPLERVVRRSLGIVPTNEAIAPESLLEHLDEAALRLKVVPNREALLKVLGRTIDAVHKTMDKEGTPPLRPGVIPVQAAAADTLPMLEPINLANFAELAPESLEGEAVARVELVTPRQAAPSRSASEPPSAPLKAPSPEPPAAKPATSQQARTSPKTLPLGTPALADLGPEQGAPTVTTKMPLPGATKTSASSSSFASSPTDESTFPFLATKPNLDAAAPASALDAKPTQNDLAESTAMNPRASRPVTTTGPEQSAIGGQASSKDTSALLGDEPSFDSLPELDTSDVMEIPSVSTAPPAFDPFSDAQHFAPAVVARPPPRTQGIPRGLFADPPEEAVNRGHLREDTRHNNLEDDTDPGHDSESAKSDSSDHSEGFIEEKTLPNIRITADTDTEQGHAEAKSASTTATPLGRAVNALLARDVITEAHVKTAVAAQRERGGRLLEILVQLQAVADVRVADVLAEASLRPRILAEGLTAQLPNAEICRKLPQTYAQSRRLLPLVVDDGILTLAVVDPFADDDIEEVRRLLKADSVAIKVATRAAITDAISEAYRRAGLLRNQSPTARSQGILLCAKDDGTAEHLGQRLVTEGFSIELANSAAVARAALDNRIAHAVICDTRLEGDEDAALLRFARGTERLEDTPFFVYGPEDDALEARVLDLGADDYFSLPLNLDVLVKKLRRAIAKTAATTDALLDKQLGAQTLQAPVKRSPSLLDEAPPVEAPLSIPRMVTMVGLVPGLDRLRDLPDLSDVGDPPPPAAPPPTNDGFDPFAMPPSTPVPMGEPTGVMGTLRQMSVSEIVQSLELGRKSARVELVPSIGERGALAFTGGQVVYAECNELRGEDAFYVLASQQEGFFRIHYGVEPEERNIEKPSMFLLLEAARKADEESEGIE